jgi:hypothetical protein
MVLYISYMLRYINTYTDVNELNIILYSDVAVFTSATVSMYTNLKYVAFEFFA